MARRPAAATGLRGVETEREYGSRLEEMKDVWQKHEVQSIRCSVLVFFIRNMCNIST